MAKSNMIVMNVQWLLSLVWMAKLYYHYGWLKSMIDIVMHGQGAISQCMAKEYGHCHDQGILSLSWMAKEYYHYLGWPRGTLITLRGQSIQHHYHGHGPGILSLL